MKEFRYSGVLSKELLSRLERGTELATLLNDLDKLLVETCRVRCKEVKPEEGRYWLNQLHKARMQLRNVRWFLGI